MQFFDSQLYYFSAENLQGGSGRVLHPNAS